MLAGKVTIGVMSVGNSICVVHSGCPVVTAIFTGLLKCCLSRTYNTSCFRIGHYVCNCNVRIFNSVSSRIIRCVIVVPGSTLPIEIVSFMYVDGLAAGVVRMLNPTTRDDE